MPTYSVHIVQTVSTNVEVQADSVEEALDKFYDSPGMPGAMAHGAFGEVSVDESGDWEPVAVYDTADWSKPVWEDKD